MTLEPTSYVRKPRAPMLRTAPFAQVDMRLPIGASCGNCRHFARCTALFGAVAADELCTFAPSRFQEAMQCPQP